MNFHFFKCVLCGEVSSEAVKIGGHTLTYPVKDGLCITLCLCDECYRYAVTRQNVLDKLVNDFLELYGR
jgi:hypothetical protein